MASSSTTGSTTSASNSNPWAPYDGYKDCTQGICSIYCPQWCYIIFPPPPPFSLEDDSGTDFSPLIIAVIGILASAFILVSYYTIISKYCRRRHNDDTTNAVEFHENHSVNNDAWQNGNNGTGLDEALIKSITVCKYKKGDGLVEGTDCSVCLSEFLEDESLRLLPKCNHAFHLPCIDTWLKSHSTCPLCRANIIASTHPQTLPPDHPPPQETMTRSETATVSVNQYQHRNNETVLVIHQVMESGVGEEEAAVVNLVVNDDHHHHVVVELPKTPLRGDVENLGELRHNNTSSHDHQHQVGVGVQVDQVQPIRRSVSMNSSVCQGPLSIADILRSNEDDDDDDDDDQMEKNRTNRVLNLVRNSPFALKRTVSTGRFMFTRYGKSGNNSIIPN